MNGETMVFLIVLIAVIGGIIKQSIKANKDRRGRPEDQPDHGDAARLRGEVQQLRERIQVLERVITDSRHSVDLNQEIERLRDR